MNTLTSFKRIPWIFFDLDDTLWDFSSNSAFALLELYKISPILRKLFKDLEEFVDIYHQNNSLMWALYSQGKVNTVELKLERWRRTLATRQFEVLTAVCEELDREYLHILAKGPSKIKGSEELLEKLTKKCLVAILSNGFSGTQYEKLQYSGLEKYITRTIVSEEIGINKPDPRFFRYAVEETGALSPFLMVGDNLEADIFGAIGAGWNAIWYNPAGKIVNSSFLAKAFTDPKPYGHVKEELQKRGLDPALLVAIVNNMEEMEETLKSLSYL